MSEKIVVAIDGSDTGDRALNCAAELSNKLGKDLCIVHVLLHGRPSEEMLRLAEVEHLLGQSSSQEAFRRKPVPKSLREIVPSIEEELELAMATGAIAEHVLSRAKQRAEDLGARNVTTRTCAGDYADEILQIADSEKAEFIVIGSRGLGRIREVLLGSVSQKVLHHAACTVVVVR